MADTLTRRAALTGLVLAPGLARAATAPRADLHFEVWRKGQKIGAHSVGFHGDDAAMTVAIAAEMLVKLGPIPVFRYRHQASETWREGRFATLESHTASNGKVEQVSAERSETGVEITAGGKTVQASARACPLTHWNCAVLDGPLFNPQTGLVVREAMSRTADTVELADGRTVNATRYQLRGDAEIVDWYDPTGAWAALRGKVGDGSWIEYRRV